MRIKSLITTLAIVGSTSTVALANPDRDRGYDDRPYDRGYDQTYDRGYDRGYDRTYNRPYDQGRSGRSRWNRPGARIWFPQIDRVANLSRYNGPVLPVFPDAGFVPLTEPTRIETIREAFDLSGTSPVDALKLEAVQGRTYVTQIGVQYGNGEQEMIPVNQTIDDRRHPESSTIELRGRNRHITLVSVYGTSEPGSAFRLLASSMDRRRY